MIDWIDAHTALPTKHTTYFVKANGMKKILYWHELEHAANVYDSLFWLQDEPYTDIKPFTRINTGSVFSTTLGQFAKENNIQVNEERFTQAVQVKRLSTLAQLKTKYPELKHCVELNSEQKVKFMKLLGIKDYHILVERLYYKKQRELKKAEDNSLLITKTKL